MLMKKTASILLAFLFLLSSSHLSFATHFCGGHAFKHALLIDANGFGCGMEDEVRQCEKKTDQLENKCCENELINLTIQDNFQQNISKISTEQHFVLINVAAILFSIPVTDQNVALYKDYKTPLPDKDIPILIQSFLI